MYNQHPNSLAASKQRHEHALARYYASPNFCQNPDCGRVIEVGPKDKIYDVRRRKFCGHSCAAKFNNLGVRRHGGVGLTNSPTGNCEMCGRLIRFKRKSTQHVSFKDKKLCPSCEAVQRVITRGQTPISQRTKRDIVACGKTPQLGRARITGNARAVFWASGEPKSCKVCGYERHIEICHKRSIKDWPDDTLIGEINSIENLVALCPTHHWELDNGYLALE